MQGCAIEEKVIPTHTHKSWTKNVVIISTKWRRRKKDNTDFGGEYNFPVQEGEKKKKKIMGKAIENWPIQADPLSMIIQALESRNICFPNSQIILLHLLF